VVRVGDEWRMFYDGQRGDEAAHGDRSIGLATSPDGRVWEKTQGPVLTAGGDGSWDARRVYDPNVVVTPDGFVMTYTTSLADMNTGSLEYSFGLATSDDGTTWTKHPQNPILNTRAAGLGAVFLSSMEHHDGSYLLAFDARGGLRGETTVWVLGHDGPLPTG
jgi:predicted GH43/DUF377 family glycosyl hydrolase